MRAKIRGAFVAVVLGIGVGCTPTMQRETLRLEVTTPDGERIRDTIRAPTSWDLDSLGNGYASWPHASEFGVDLPLGLLAQLYPFQPGSYDAINSSLVVDGQTFTTVVGGVTMHVERVRFTGNGHFPFDYEGRVDGTIDGYALEGEWTISNDDCDEDLVAGYGCGGAFPTADFAEETWQVTTWGGNNPCPAEIADRWIAGDTVTIGRDRAQAGDADALDCVVTDPEDYQLICGADDPSVAVGDRTWSATAVAWSGISWSETPMTFAVLGGTVDDGTPQLCATLAQAMTPL